MTTVLPALPAEVMEALRPAFDALAVQVRSAVLAGTEKTVRRKAEAFVRSLGTTHYDAGHDAIMRDVFGSTGRPIPHNILDAVNDDDEDDEDGGERTCACADCNLDDCEGECEPCDDIDCEQCHGDDHNETYDCATCHDVRSCCKYCEQCDTHHDDMPDDRYDNERCGECNHCRRCDHYCDD